ncbi:cation:proton antiporter [Promicromonospora sp. Populi]|uniref:cation:proton antiporter n=1 Tax=Promicromonospora sp. Populi TaxID=3239420 RepID=UPI0034E2F972
MTEPLVVIVTALVAIAAATVAGPRLGIAAPLVLVGIGVAASFLPVFESTHIEPEWILEGVLPPLLYSAAVSMPAMNFRREFGAISGLSVLLVVGSALALGLFFMLVIPDLGFAWGVALGAIVSPTDAVATSIVKQTPVSKRVVAMLDGESLLNDATALVLLRTAIVATAASFSFWGAVGTFAYSVAVAVAIGGVVSWLNLTVRRRLTDPTVNTVLSFTVPFVAVVLAEALGASGLVAAVVAGLITGIRAARELSPQNRLSDAQNWRTVELVLEGAVFLTMGLQIKEIVTSVQRDHAGVGTAVLIAGGALLLTILVRAAYVTPLLGILARRVRRGEQLQPRLQGMQEKLATPEGAKETFAEVSARSQGRAGSRGRAGGARPQRRMDERRTDERRTDERNIDRFALRVTRVLADIDYFLREPLGWREGTAIVWAGMRGAVTVAAAQTLPEDTPQRSLLVLIAFAVALLSLLVQGGTLGPLLRRITPDVDQAAVDEQDRTERARIFALMRTAAEAVPAPPEHEPEPEGEREGEYEAGNEGEHEPDHEATQEGPHTREQFAGAKQYRLAVIAAQRSALLDARDNGTFDADVLAYVLANLDAAQIDLEMRGGPTS